MLLLSINKTISELMERMTLLLVRQTSLTIRLYCTYLIISSSLKNPVSIFHVGGVCGPPGASRYGWPILLGASRHQQCREQSGKVKVRHLSSSPLPLVMLSLFASKHPHFI